MWWAALCSKQFPALEAPSITRLNLEIDPGYGATMLLSVVGTDTAQLRKSAGTGGQTLAQNMQE